MRKRRIVRFVYRSYRYRLYPTRAQKATLISWLAMGCELYNAALQERRDAWRRQRASIKLFDQQHSLAEVRALRPEFASVPIDVLRGWLRRLDKAFRAFFRRCKSGGAPGFPRFRSRLRFSTIDLDQVNAPRLVAAGGKRISVPLLGKVKFKQHRLLKGTPKALRIARDGDRWWVTIQCADVATRPLTATGREIGLDLGITTYIATSDGETIATLHARRDAERSLARAHRRVSRRRKGSNRRHKAVAVLRRNHQRIANIRREYAITAARSLVARYDTIYVEDLNVQGLASGILAKSVRDAAWATQLHWIRVKAEEAGREVIAVDPRGTSQECSDCGARVPKDLSIRIHRCPSCGLVIDRDVNAARNILSRGRRDRGGMSGSRSPAIRVASESLRE